MQRHSFDEKTVFAIRFRIEKALFFRNNLFILNYQGRPRWDHSSISMLQITWPIAREALLAFYLSIALSQCAQWASMKSSAMEICTIQFALGICAYCHCNEIQRLSELRNRTIEIYCISYSYFNRNRILWVKRAD